MTALLPGLHPEESDLVGVLVDALGREAERGPAAARPWTVLGSMGIDEVMSDRSCPQTWARRLFLCGYATGRAGTPTPLASVVAAAVLCEAAGVHPAPDQVAAPVDTLVVAADRPTTGRTGTRSVTGNLTVEGLDVATRIVLPVGCCDSPTGTPPTLLAVGAIHARIPRPAGRVESRGIVDDVVLDRALGTVLGVLPVAATTSTTACTDAAAAAGVVLAGEAAGIHERWIARTAEHLRTRVQFGAPLATRQATRHQLVDWWLAAEQLRALGWRAARSGADPDHVAAARLLAARAAHVATATSVQLHGGIGMVDELPLGRSMRRLLEATAVVTTTGGSRERFTRSAAGRPRLTEFTPWKEQR